MKAIIIAVLAITAVFAAEGGLRLQSKAEFAN